MARTKQIAKKNWPKSTIGKGTKRPHAGKSSQAPTKRVKEHANCRPEEEKEEDSNQMESYIEATSPPWGG